MRYSTKPRFRKYVKGYGFLSFARKFGDKNCRSFGDKNCRTAGDLIGNKIADKITSIGKPNEKEKEKTNKTEKIYIPPEKRQQTIDDLKLF